MKKTLISLAFLAGMPTMTYLGLVAGVDGALYVTKFVVWAVCLPLGLLALTETIQKSLAQEPEAWAIRKAAWRLVAWACLGMMVWTGHIATAMAWGLHMFCMAASSEGVKKLRAAQPAAQNQSPA